METDLSLVGRRLSASRETDGNKSNYCKFATGDLYTGNMPKKKIELELLLATLFVLKYQSNQGQYPIILSDSFLPGNKRIKNVFSKCQVMIRCTRPHTPFALRLEYPITANVQADSLHKTNRESTAYCVRHRANTW